MREGTPAFPGARAQDRRLAAMVRVDHAGEFGAVQIYRGQHAVFSRAAGKEQTASLIAEMEEGERHHLETFDRLIAERRVRPTLMAPVWRVAGFGLGVATALLGERAAHACTEAVEEVIEDHYARQAQEIGPTDPELSGLVKQFREEELQHRDTAIANGARDAPGYSLLSGAIKLGCRAAIYISERV